MMTYSYMLKNISSVLAVLSISIFVNTMSGCNLLKKDTAKTEDFEAKRKACYFKTGQYPTETLPDSYPRGNKIPIEHFVIVMQENHSFDNYFQALDVSGQPDADVAPSDFFNPDSNGERVKIHESKTLCIKNPKHGWSATHKEYNSGKMDGFVKENDPDGARAMSFFTEEDIPFYYELARTFSICDRYFSSILGPTFPNRMYSIMATSMGVINNTDGKEEYLFKTIYYQLETAGISWKIYSDSETIEEKILPNLRTLYGDHFSSINDYMKDAASGILPQVSWIETNHSSNGDKNTDEHPPYNITNGQLIVYRVVTSLLSSPEWKRSALFIVYDEHGGFYDHVPPPKSCKPDNIPPVLEAKHYSAEFNNYGIRVPFIVVSPFSKKGYVSHTVNSHESILRLLQTRFSLPALTDRDANASPLLEFFDFKKPPFLNPPKIKEPSVEPCDFIDESGDDGD